MESRWLTEMDEDMAQANDGTSYSTENDNITTLSDAERERHWETILGRSTTPGADAAFQAEAGLRINGLNALLAREAAAARDARNDSRPGVRQSAQLQADIGSPHQPLARFQPPSTQPGSWLSGLYDMSANPVDSSMNKQLEEMNKALAIRREFRASGRGNGAYFRAQRDRNFERTVVL